MMNSQVIKDLFLDAFYEVIFFPVWWYSAGLKKALVFCWQQVVNGWQATALPILLAAFFKPMYAEKGFAAYLLSFMVRIWQISWRLVFMIIWLALWLLILILWLVLPPYALYRLIFG